MIDWPAAIAEMMAARQDVFEADGEGLWRRDPPRPPAAVREIEAVERRLETRLPAEFRAFLTTANGWPALMQEIDLFGTPELLGERYDSAVELISYMEESVWHSVGSSWETAIPVAASLTGIDLILLGATGSPRPGEVLWLAGGEVERYATFASFFQAMQEHNLKEAQDLRSGR